MVSITEQLNYISSQQKNLSDRTSTKLQVVGFTYYLVREKHDKKSSVLTEASLNSDLDYKQHLTI